ncbi:MAG TPA: HlyD family efflux transporter periplasmic adaptor subunit, partial [Tepidisphaeraceae bacterium]|nr:HlyD family efflux transporter periplasmic adaptor subunit [Tepidisphaeraceae bacterium]
GDTVRAGDVLLEFDTREIAPRLFEAQARKAAAEQEAQAYLNDPTGDRMADYRLAMERAREAQAQIDFHQMQLDKAVVRAPIDGVVLAGDLQDRTDSTVKIGEVLFEIAPSGSMRADLYVPERDIQRLGPGSRGELATSSLPSDKHAFTVTRIIPMSEARQNSTVFRVQVELDEIDTAWRPGMEGEARVDVEPKPLIWTWTHRLVEFVRITFWM